MATSSDRLVQEAIAISKESSSVSEMLRRLGVRMKEMLGADEAFVREVYQKQARLTQAEEAVLNTRRPYLDNRLSGYSAFGDLINYYNSGFKSCIMLPIATERNGFGIITLLSRKEEGFEKGAAAVLEPVARMLGSELDSRLELERSVSMARYFDAAFDGPFPQFIIDKDMRIVKANKAALSLLGMTQKEASGAGMVDLFGPAEKLGEAFRNGRAADVRTAKSGREFRMSARQINDGLSYAVLDEVTGQRDLESRIGLVGLSRGEVFIMLDREMRITWIGGDGNALKTDYGSLVGRRMGSLVKDADASEMINFMRHGEGEYRGHATLRLDNGIEMEMGVAARRVGDGYAVVVSDDMRRYAERLSRDIDDIISVFPEAVVIIDEEGFVKKANKSAERLLGYGGGELEGVPISKICEEDESRDRMNSALELARKMNVVTDFFLNFSAREGGVVPVTENVKAMRDAQGRITGYMLIGKELGTKRQMEELRGDLDEMTRKAEKFKQESDLKTQFIFNVSHELKTPITNINGYARLLMGGNFGDLSEEQMDSVKTIITEDDRLMQLIQQILDVAKLEAGKIKLDWQDVDLNSIRENPSIKSLEEMVRNKGLEYEFSIDYSVPRIEADPNRLIQVFVNLIVNAYKFTDRGSIRIKAFRKGKNVRVEVSDTGLGISPEEKAKLFRRFYQLHKRGLTKQEGSGTGLGLSIVKEIVALHGGRVGVGADTALGKGSTFWFTLPIHRKPKKKDRAE